MAQRPAPAPAGAAARAARIDTKLGTDLGPLGAELGTIGFGALYAAHRPGVHPGPAIITVAAAAESARAPDNAVSDLLVLAVEPGKGRELASVLKATLGIRGG